LPGIPRRPGFARITAREMRASRAGGRPPSPLANDALTSFRYRRIYAVKLVVEKAAAKALMGMPPKTAAAISSALKAIAADPSGKHPNVKPLKGYKGGYRLRHGDWRAVYRIDRAADTMLVEWIGPRGDAYR
jgi:mRNA interferase RelE/StbE